MKTMPNPKKYSSWSRLLHLSSWSRLLRLSSWSVAIGSMAILAACGSDDSSQTGPSGSSLTTEGASIFWAGSFNSPEEIQDPQYLWAYYNTTDGCSYIYTYGGWTLLAGGVSSQNNVNGNDGKDVADGKDGKDGVNGINGKDGTNGIDGKDVADGKDGKDGKDGEDGYVFIGESEQLVDGVSFNVKSYALLEAGNPYLYTYFKFFFIEEKLLRTYVCYHNTGSINLIKVPYYDFTEDDCNESSYIRNFSSNGYVTSSAIVSNVNGSITKSISTYYPSTDQIHYYLYYKNGSLISAIEYDRSGNTLSTNQNTILAAMGNNQSTQNYSGSDDVDTTNFVKSITLDRYHILGSSSDRNILVTIIVDDISLADTSDGIFIQVTNSSQDTVINFRPYFVKNDTIKAIIAAPEQSNYYSVGNEYIVRLKVGEKVYKNRSSNFNVSSSYSDLTLSYLARINIDKANSDSFSVSINGYNLDFINSMYVRILNSDSVQLGDSVNIDLTPIQWLGDTCKNTQKVFTTIPTPQNEGTYTIELYVDNQKYSLSNNTFIVHKNPYFTSFVIPGTSINYAGDFVSAMLKGKNYVNAALDIAQLNLTFSDEYKVIDTLKYEATIVHDSLINLKIYIPQKKGEYNVSAHYENESISAIFKVGGAITSSSSVTSSSSIASISSAKSSSSSVTSSSSIASSSSVVPTSSSVASSSSDGNVNCSALLEGETGWNWDVPKECRLNPEFTYGTMTDSRDGKIYKTVKIGDQTWMAENLNYADSTKTPSLKGKSWCYNDVAANCDVAGRLYTWAAAMDSVKTGCGYRSTCSPTLPVQGICPSGWHLPSQSEWSALFTAVGGSSTAGEYLKSQTGWYSSGNGTDAFGFSALPAGDRYYDGDFSRDGNLAYFWSSTENGIYRAYYMYLNYYYDYAYLDDYYKYNGFSVRCLRD